MTESTTLPRGLLDVLEALLAAELVTERREGEHFPHGLSWQIVQHPGHSVWYRLHLYDDEGNRASLDIRNGLASLRHIPADSETRRADQ